MPMGLSGRFVCVLGLVAAAAASTTLSKTQAGYASWAKTLLECHVCKTSQLTGVVDDCCIDFTTVDDATKHFFLPILKDLQSRIFFKYFKTNLNKDCPFWEEDGQCFMRDCSVCECNPEEIPKPWLEEDEREATMSATGDVDVLPSDDCVEQMRKEKACQDKSHKEKLWGKVDQSPVADVFNPWDVTASKNAWAEQDEDETDLTYINLELNPERHTGYNGASAQKVWRAIYLENCFGGFQGGSNTCKEKRVFFRLLSGLQSSITTQIANEYRFEDGTWGANVELFTRAVGMHTDRLTNLYFAYIFVLRAIAKARPWLLEHNYDTGNAEDDLQTRSLIERLARAESQGGLYAEEFGGDLPRDAVPMCMNGFDESGLFRASSPEEGGAGLEPWLELQDKADLKVEFMHKFENISRIMECVGCEKCKLWGKLETLGLGTAIKIMLATDQEAQAELESLSRNELIALINTAAQLAKSVGTIPKWKWLEVEQHLGRTAPKVLAGVGAVIAVAVLLVWRGKGAPSISSKRRPPDNQGAHSANGNGVESVPEGSGARQRPRRKVAGVS